VTWIVTEYKYRNNARCVAEGERTMTFFHNARVDGLEKRAETPTEMTETFINRDDFLVYRHVVYGVRQKKLAPANDIQLRPIEVRCATTGDISRSDAISAPQLKTCCFIFE
jgi:hypothetical protein